MKLLSLVTPTSPVGGLLGTINPVGPITGDPIVGISSLIVFGIRMFMLIVAFAVLVYLLWGTFDWITSGGDKEKVSKAQQKMTYAVVGIVLVMVVFAVFALLAGDVLGIMIKDANGNWIFKIPIFHQPLP